MARLWHTRRTPLGSEADRATFRTLHTASLASTALREGLTEESADRSIGNLHALLGSPAVALTDTRSLLAWDGVGRHHADYAGKLAQSAIEHGSTRVAQGSEVDCGQIDCGIRSAVVSPLVVEERLVGTLQAYSMTATAGLVRACDEVAHWVSGQLELAEFDASRRRLMEAEVRALRAQISPHFIYNSLGAIASFVRTDPERARELILEFADFTRYSFRRHGEYTTLADELRSVERYLMLEQARFGNRLKVTLRIAPEVLSVAVPFLCIQPLVENAVKHGLESKEGSGHIQIIATDRETEAEISVEDDGTGEDPELVRRTLAGDTSRDSVGLGNVDARLRSAFGADYGLVVETAPQAGTRVIVRAPKYAPGVHA